MKRKPLFPTVLPNVFLAVAPAQDGLTARMVEISISDQK
jgi:hypothetical protein